MSLYAWSQVDEVSSDAGGNDWHLTTRVQQMDLSVADLRWDMHDVPMVADLIHRPSREPERARLWRGAHLDQGGDYIIGMYRPVAVRGDPFGAWNMEFERLVLRPDWLLERSPPSAFWQYSHFRQYSYGMAGRGPQVCHVPSTAALSAMGQYFYPTPAALRGLWPVSLDPPIHPASGWSLQPHSGGVWASSHSTGGISGDSRYTSDGYATSRDRASRPEWSYHRRADRTLHAAPPPALLGAVSYPAMTYPKQGGGLDPLDGGAYAFGSMLDPEEWVQAHYGLPPEVTAAIWHSTGGLEWRLRLEQRGGGAIAESFTAWQAVPTYFWPDFSLAHSSLLTTVAAPGSLDIDASYYRYAVEVRDIGTGDPVTPGIGAIHHQLPCGCWGWASSPGPFAADGARYWPGWLRFVTSL